MKKASLFLSVAWLAINVVPVEGFSVSEGQGWRGKLNSARAKVGGMFQKKQPTPVYTSGFESVPMPMAEPVTEAPEAEPVTARPSLRERLGQGVQGLKAKFKRSESDSSLFGVELASIPLPESTSSENVRTVVEILKANLTHSNKLGKLMKVTYSDIPSYLAALKAGKEFPASKSRARVCSTQCGGLTAAASGSVHEAFCVYGCARGVVLSERALQNMQKNYGKKANEARKYWEELEGEALPEDHVIPQTEQAARNSLMRLESAAKKQGPVKDAVQMNARKALVAAIADLTVAYADFKREMGVMNQKAETLRQKADAVSESHTEALNHGVEDMTVVFNEGKEDAQSAVSKLKNPLLMKALSGVTLLDHDMIQGINKEIQAYEAANQKASEALDGVEKKK